MRIICVGLMATYVAGWLIAGAVSAPIPAAMHAMSSDISKLRGDLAEVVEQAGDDELIPVSVVMTHQALPADLEVLQQLPVLDDRRRQVIAHLKEVAESSQDLVSLLEDEQANGNVGSRLRPLWIHNVVVTEATPGVILRIADRNDVAYLNYNRPVPAEDIFPVPPKRLEPDQMPATSGNIECGVELMRAPMVWNDFGITGNGVVVCVLDSGACTTHPDLVNQIWANPGEIPNNGVDDDNNGFIDDIVGWDFADNDNNPNDIFNHGTHVSGTVGGDGTNGTQTGMAPDVMMMECKISGFFSDEAQVWDSMQYAVDNGADIITASLGWPHSVGPDRPTWRSVCENTIATGMVVIYASGNEGGCCPPDNVRTPGDVPDVITIGATDCNRNIAGFSSRGPVTWQNIPPYNDWPYPPGKMKPTVSAPGVNTVSTVNNCVGYGTNSGTSMATPHVSGAVALMLEANPNLDHFDVKQILVDTAIDRGPAGWDNDYGAGFVDAYDAVVAAMAGGSVCADSGTLIEGTAEINDFNAACGSDNTRWGAHGETLFFQVADPVVQFELSATASTDTPGSISIDVEASKQNNNANLNLRALIFNFDSGSYEAMPGVIALGTTDVTQTFNLPGGANPSDFVDGGGTNEVRVLLQTIQTSGIPNVRTRIDQVLFTAN